MISVTIIECGSDYKNNRMCVQRKENVIGRSN